MKVKIEFDVSEEFVGVVCEKYGFEREEVLVMLENLDGHFKKYGEVILEEQLNLFDV